MKYMVHTNSKKYGFTVMELSIAIIVFSLVMGMAYKIFSGASVGFQRSTKSLSMQNEMRNGLNFIREEMQRASYKSNIEINGNSIEYGYYFKLCKETEIDGKSNKELAQWYICKPYKNNKDGVVFKCTLRITNGEIVYSRIKIDGSDSENEFQNKVVMTQIGKIRFSTENITSVTSGQVTGALINIETFAVNTTSGQADLTVSAQTGAKVEVLVKQEI
ncbi:MAG: prepilin-type N-terminal cleavage/methylation domain-containing protein [Candidatus Riflebacteria bacterium]|nr:prepilin-type N-terminal cleavage/methylation domain-containing protein [Candidatus Riflebacteria bacterium]